MNGIAEMNSRLIQLNSFFSSTTDKFVCPINLHQTKFTLQDFVEFDDLITEIKKEVNAKISHFFDQKLQQHSQNYEKKITNFTENAQELQCELFSFRTELEKHTMHLKHQEQRNEEILDHFSRKFFMNSLKQKCLSVFKKNVELNQQQSHIYSEAEKMYQKNLIKRAFFPWRTLTYKDGHENKILQQTQQDIQNIHSQYSSIIAILKQKIRDTDELVKVKKAAKNEFAYALSKNLMKTISNLSLEVMSLNQVSLKDEEYSIGFENQKFMKQVDRIVDQKIRQVHEYKQNLMSGSTERGGERQRRIRFV